MNDILREIASTGLVTDDSGAKYPLHSQIPMENGRFLSELIEREKPRRSLEVGLAYGISAMFICDALRKVGADSHIVIDPLQHGNKQGLNLHYASEQTSWKKLGWSVETGWRGIGLLNLARCGHRDLVQFRGTPSHLELPQLVKDGTRFDFAFVDGWHTFDYVLVEFFFIDLLLRTGGCVVFDDSNYPSIRKVLRYVLTNRRYEVIAEQAPPKLAPSWRKRGITRTAETLRKSHLLSPEWSQPDDQLGLPARRCIALRKLADDVLGDGSDGSRCWNFHKPF